MSTWQRIAVVAIVVAAAVALLLGRYQISGAGEGFGVYRLDRWTGAVWVYTVGWAKEIQPAPDKE